MSQGCLVEGCDRKHEANGYCGKHNCQLRRCGRILKRSLKDPNEIILEHDICRINLYDLSGAVKDETIIDAEDYHLVKNHKWSLINAGYAFTRIGKKAIGLSSLVLGVHATRQYVVDHKDGNTLNNRKNNLRQCTTQENFFNQKLRSNNVSGFKGVHWDKQLGKWRARIKVNYIGKHLGCFVNKEDAAVAYNNAALKNYGEFARLNIIDMGV